MNQGRYLEPSTQHYGDFLVDWLAGKKSGINSQTYIVYEIYIRVHINPQLGSIPLAKLNAAAVQNFITVLSDKGLASATIKRIYNVVHGSLAAAVRLKLIQENPADLVISKPKVRRREVKVWNEEQIRHFLAVAEQHTRYYIAFHMALATGMRQGEILGLRWSDVDLDNGVIHIRQTVSHDGKEIRTEAKTKSSLRSISIDPETIRALKRHHVKQAEEKLVTGPDYQQNGLVVCTYKGTVTKPRSLVDVWYSLVKRSALPQIKFHGLRHTHASILLKLGVHPKVVQERLGHSSIQMTLDLYSHLFSNLQSEAAIVLGKTLFSS